MPLYELKCRECDHNWEVRQEWKAPLPDCPACGSAEVKKVLHAAALVFKGSGWHVNDYSKTGAKSTSSSSTVSPAAKSDSTPATTESSSSTSTTTESKGSSDSTAKPDSTASAAKKD